MLKMTHEKCRNADRYKGVRPPTCGCKTCETIYTAARADAARNEKQAKAKTKETSVLESQEFFVIKLRDGTLCNETPILHRSASRAREHLTTIRRYGPTDKEILRNATVVPAMLFEIVEIKRK